MPSDPTYHVLLLPRENYWEWVEASRGYAVRFGISITALPQNAARFHPPHQIISVVAAPDAYPGYGDIVAWLKAQAPEARLDVLEVTAPNELHPLLQSRISSGMRLGLEPGEGGTPGIAPPFHLLWPTDHPLIVQGFGQNPEIYRRWGLPGHEGVDIQAPLNAAVYACADGLVYLVHDGAAGHPYGIHVRIRHADGFSTIYAHLNQALVHAGQIVSAGERIGLADSTGNTTGGHVHLTFKKEGATAAGLTSFPNDILDPTPFLFFPPERRPPAPLPAEWPYRHCLVGLHGRVDGPMERTDWDVVRDARIEALKLSRLASPEDVDRAREVNPNIFVLVGLSADFRNRRVDAATFAQVVEDDLSRFYDKGVRYFELHNEPNLTLEGYGSSWRSGREFGEWFLQAVGYLKPTFPEARFGWPGLSPGPTAGMRFDHTIFLESAGALVNQADWIGCHCYWHSEGDMLSPEGGLGFEFYRARWPDKLIFITEFSNPSPQIDWQTRASQYLRYYRYLYDQAGLGAALSFAISASSSFQNETWRSEDGRLRPVASIVGMRAF